MAMNLSTAPWDQPRQGSTITLWGNTKLPDHMRVEFDHGPRYKIEAGRRIVGRCLLVSWPNLAGGAK